MYTRNAVLTLAILILAFAVGRAVFAQAEVVVKEQITVTVDKNEVRTDVPPISVQNQTLVPVRGIFNAFNADIQWYPSTRRVHVVGNNKDIWVGIGLPYADVNNTRVSLSVPPMIYRGRTMVPLRFIAETLGATVSWDPASQQITILTQRTAQSAPAPPQAAPPAVVVPAPPTTATPGTTGAGPYPDQDQGYSNNDDPQTN